MSFNVTSFLLGLPDNFIDLSFEDKSKYLNQIPGFTNLSSEIQTAVYDLDKEILLELHRQNERIERYMQRLANLVAPSVPTTEAPPICGANADLLTVEGFILAVMISAGVIIIVLSFFKTRKRILPKVLWGRPAIVYPIDFVTEYARRWAYAAVFTLLAYRTMKIFFGNLYFLDPPAFHVDDDTMKELKFKWLSAIRQMLNVLLVGFAFYPFLACIGLRKHILANLFGIVYLVPWIYEAVVKAINVYPTCISHAHDGLMFTQGVIVLIGEIPQYIVFIVLLVTFAFELIVNVLELMSRNLQVAPGGIAQVLIRRDSEEEFYVKYVRALLKRKPREKPESVLKRIRQKLKYEIREGFMYSTRIICTMFFAAISLYLVGSELKAYIDYYNSLLQKVDNATITALAIAYEVITSKAFDNVDMYTARAQSIVQLIIVALYIGVYVSFVLQVTYMIHMIIMYKKHMTKLIQGRSTFHHKKLHSQSPPSLLVAQMRYSGYQIAYIIWGFLITFLALTLVIFVVGLFIVLPIVDHRSSFLIRLLEKHWPNLLLALVLYFLQVILSKLAFLQERGKYLALNNRRVYHVFTYFMFIYNIILGLISCLKRILLAVGFGILLLPRLDRVLLMKGFENFDAGHKAYLAMLYVDLYHNHPVMRAFIHILQESVAETKLQHTMLKGHTNGITLKRIGSSSDLNLERTDMKSEYEYEEKLRFKRHIRNKWWKFVTLINNPSLVLEEVMKDVQKGNKQKLPLFRNSRVDYEDVRTVDDLESDDTLRSRITKL